MPDSDGNRFPGLSAPQAVLTRLASVGPQDLLHVHPEDREYAASELQATLLFWLATLPCPVFNRPSTTSLAGPGWSNYRWLRLAASLGLPTAPLPLSTRAPLPALHADCTLTVVGQRCLGQPTHPAQVAGALALAEAAEISVLQSLFAGPALVGVSVCPPLRTPEEQAALLSLLCAA